MTFKEKLQMEHPEKISENEWYGCPHHYGYEETWMCPRDKGGYLIPCQECWDREMPEETEEEIEEVEKEVKKSGFITFTLKQTGRKISINPLNIEAVMEREDGAVIFCSNDDFSVRESHEEVTQMLRKG